ncbi:MAG: radical SAM protein [Gemmataceae bacterium]
MGPNHAPVKIVELVVRQLEPNLTAILPGKCQARCRFCLEPEGPRPPSVEEWLGAFRSLLQQLPPLFRVLSLSGGEPSLSPVFHDVLDLLRQHRDVGRLRRIVLTSNGRVEGMTRHLDALGRAVTHVNISRHAVDDELNARIFRTHDVPTTSELALLIAQLNRRGVPVNLNCVYSELEAFGRRSREDDIDEWRADASQFVNFARTVGASSVTFRHDHREPHLEQPTPLEAAFEEIQTIHSAECRSCRVVGKLISGMAVNFKRSAYEPIKFHDRSELYEMVFHSDGRLYRDWSRRHPIALPLEPALDLPMNLEPLAVGRGNYQGLATSECDQAQPQALNRCQLMKTPPGSRE